MFQKYLWILITFDGLADKSSTAFLLAFTRRTWRSLPLSSGSWLWSFFCWIISDGPASVRTLAFHPFAEHLQAKAVYSSGLTEEVLVHNISFKSLFFPLKCPSGLLDFALLDYFSFAQMSIWFFRFRSFGLFFFCSSVLRRWSQSPDITCYKKHYKKLKPSIKQICS
jgi:hypothetical protein